MKRTLLQLNGILKPGGNLLMAVPLGWERNSNRPYFFLENEWLSLLEDSGFRIRIYQIGSEYPEDGYDLFVAAQKTSAPSSTCRIKPEDFLKENFTFFGCQSPSVELVGGHVAGDYALMDSRDWRIKIRLSAGLREVLPIFSRHHWSGIVRVRSTNDAVFADLFRQNRATQPVRLMLSSLSAFGQELEVAPVGKNEASFSNQAVFVGYMTK